MACFFASSAVGVLGFCPIWLLQAFRPAWASAAACSSGERGTYRSFSLWYWFFGSWAAKYAPPTCFSAFRLPSPLVCCLE